MVKSKTDDQELTGILWIHVGPDRIQNTQARKLLSALSFVATKL